MLKDVAKPTLDFAQHQTARDHVVNSLFFLGEAGNDVADHEWNHARDYFCEEATRSPAKRNRLTGHVGHL